MSTTINDSRAAAKEQQAPEAESSLSDLNTESTSLFERASLVSNTGRAISDLLKAQLIGSEVVQGLNPDLREQVEQIFEAAEGNRQYLEAALRAVPEAERAELISQLHKFTQPGQEARVADELGRALGTVLKQLARPETINQGEKATCTVTTFQHNLATNDPAEYARVMADLLTTGQAELKGGATMRLFDGQLHDQSKNNGPERNLVDSAFQSSAFQLMAQNLRDYNNPDSVFHYNVQKDEITNGEGVSFRGAPLDLSDWFQSQLNGTRHHHTYVNADRSNVDSLMRTIAAGVDQDGNIAVGIKLNRNDEHSYHIISVNEISGNRVSYFNPWGQEESCSLNEFKNKLWAVMEDSGQEVTDTGMVEIDFSGLPRNSNNQIVYSDAEEETKNKFYQDSSIEKVIEKISPLEEIRVEKTEEHVVATEAHTDLAAQAIFEKERLGKKDELNELDLSSQKKDLSDKEERWNDFLKGSKGETS